MTFLKRIAGAALGATLLLGSGPISPPARAYVVMLEEVGSDVVATGSGLINLTGRISSEQAPIRARSFRILGR